MFDDIKKEVIETVIDEIVKDDKSNIQRDAKKQELMQMIMSKEIMSKFDDVSIEVNSSKINENSNKMYLDLLTMFGVMKELDKSVYSYTSHASVTSESMLIKAKELLDKIESCKLSLSDRYLPEYVIQRFSSAKIFDKINREYHTDRYGQMIPSRCFGYYSEGENIITLPLLRSDNSLLYDGIIEIATARLRFQLGKGFINFTNEMSNIDNAINGSNEPWSQTILSDKEFNMSFLDEKPRVVLEDTNYFYDVDSGAVAELEIDFESVNTVNEIVIDPHAKYPIDIVAIRYKKTDDKDEPLIELVYPGNKDNILVSKFSNSKISYRFNDILCKKIFILFTQRHYEKDIYLYKTQDVYKNALWLDSSVQHNDINENVVFKPMYLDRDNSSVGLNAINKSVVESSQDLTDILIGNDNKVRKVKKYEYQYGFNDIKCNNNHYDKTGYIVTKEMHLQSNAKTIEIYTNEEHQRASNGQILTDFEYYITGAKNPQMKDWLPIVPANKEIIESELLFIQNGSLAWFRFETDEVISIMKNGEELKPNSAEYELKKNEHTGLYCGVYVFNYDYNGVYSVKYKPHFTSKFINLEDNLMTSTETFKSTGESFVTLSEKPYISQGEEYCIVSIIDTDNPLSGSLVKAENVTDPFSPYLSYQFLEKESKDFQFYILDNTIYFNKPIPNNAIIDITYNHFVTKIRTKVLIRRNTSDDKWLTPVLKEIKYKVQRI